MVHQALRKAHNSMSAHEYVGEAASWARYLVNTETRGHGDKPMAIRRVARRVGVNASKFYSLVRRPQTLKALCVSVYFPLKRAYEAEVQRQIRKLQDEITLTAEIAGPDNRAVRSASALVSKAQEEART
jgi:hypothetical protein